MEFDLGLSSLVNAAGAFLFLLVGLGILALARGARQGLLFGGFATTFGATYVVENIVVFRASSDGALLVLACAAPSAAFAALLAREYARELPASDRRRIGAFAALAALLYASYWLGLGAPEVQDAVRRLGFASGGLGSAASAAILAQQVVLLGLLAVLASRAHAFREDARELRRVACLALALGPFLVFLHLQVFATATISFRSAGGLALVVGNLGIATLAAAAVVPFAALRGRTRDPLARAVFPALVAAGVVSIALGWATMPTHDEDYGIYGILRTIGVVFLVLAVVRHDLLGIPLPRIAERRGAIAMGALAVLFIVAQVGQNFFSAKYGLLTGGIVAGAFLFMAQPLQRAAERLMSGEAAPGARAREVAHVVGDVARREEMYRKALRIALHDRKVSREEELHLFQLAEELGIGAGRAMELRHEVEGAKGAR